MRHIACHVTMARHDVHSLTDVTLELFNQDVITSPSSTIPFGQLGANTYELRLFEKLWDGRFAMECLVLAGQRRSSG